jgi:hypothetical protein
VGLVEWVDVDGTVTFLHRGGQGVTRGRLNLRQPDRARGEDGRPLNAPLRMRASRADDAPALAGQLFVGYGRIGIDEAVERRAPGSAGP